MGTKFSEETLLQWLEKKSMHPAEIAAKVILIFSEAGIGKTVLACRLGQRVALITDEVQGSASLANHPDLDEKTRVIPFRDWNFTEQIIPLIEDGKFRHYDGEMFDLVVLDTISGMLTEEIQTIVKAEVTPAKGRLSAETPSQPDYLVSEQRIIPVMKAIANLQRCSVVILSHQRLGDKLTPGANLRPDGHAAAYKAMNKYVSVTAYLHMDSKGRRMLQVLPNGNGVATKSRYRFPDVVVSDDDFVAHIEKWKNER